MPKNKDKPYTSTMFVGEQKIEPIDQANFTPEPELFKPANALYEPRLWHGKLTVYHCLRCDHSEGQEDDVILHVVSHFPPNEQAQVLDDLTIKKEK